MSKRVEQLTELLAPVVEDLGFVLWGLEYLQGRGAVLRVFIDHEDGITVDNCAAVSHEISGVLDVEDPIHGEYRLEVSSPGIERRLFFPAQYSRYEGSYLQVKCHNPINERRNFRGMLKQSSEAGITLTCDGQDFVLEFENIDKANVLSEMSHGK